MFEFLKSKPRKDESATPATISVLPDSSNQHNDVRRELIRVVLKDTLRLHGVPFGLLACEVIIVARAPGEEELHIQLVMMKWNEQLLRYASALQQQLRLGLDRFDPSIDHSRYIFSWRLSPDCGCPFPFMPDPKSWRQSAMPQVEQAPVSVLDRRHTRRVPKTVPIEPSPPLASTELSNFAPTQMTPL
ncbi:MAG: hypothetical protein KJ614_02860 [Gammaproteobacteria bacterium]|uniref:hypothetical protein n=1 Tax=Rhodoferax sp. TaxID=50421 RepID=UPI001852F766|nr:hypothetical protein [Rhodoferax sp.]MBU3897858.1 hypothetical protein [Gammaproteobacteria bacterium]MBA3059251.1 hypothetical protein [Rhodoferax sp.]MBU3997315.1 hypothetical protein [Gammaproteobacteria bacterium]MBU4017933.1 hypothetical protein [Gammaproteobacteria bacterium]MBU4078612.1 hypothetical protein [Gammaproteobacteria bacterium]